MNASPEVFHESAAVYDLLYGDKDTEAEVDWILANLERHGCKPGGLILEFGSGTGRHARILGERGYQVTGVEPSANMLKLADPHPQVTFVQGDTLSADLSGKFDAVLALFHVMSYHTELSDIHAFFETASRHMEAGGLFAFDVWYSPAVHSLVPESRTVQKTNSEISVSRIATPTEDISRSVVTVSYDYAVENLTMGTSTRFTESHVMRHFTEAEIRLLADSHGFNILDAREFMSDREPSRDTWGVWLTLQKA